MLRLLAAVIGGLALGAIATGAWLRLRPEAAPLVPTSMARLTYDEAHVEGPALSPDGTLVAYASDRAGKGNLDLWVQHTAGGDPIRVTTGDGEERQPSFSPDGGHLLYRSEDEGGALYSIPTFGGAPRLVADNAYGGRYSPDGGRIAYWTGTAIGFSPRPGAYRTFVLPVASGSAVEVRSFTGVRFPVWAEDGRLLVVAASRAEVPIEDSYDWWIVDPEGGDAHAMGAAAAFRAAGVAGLVPAPAASLGDRILASGDGQLWAARHDPRPPYTVRAIERLTFGPGVATEPTISHGGLVAFVGSTPTQNIWSLPLDPETGSVRGDLRRITDGTGLNSRATLSADGRYLVYQALRGGYTVLVKDLVDGQVRDLTVSARPFGPVVSPDGSKVAYPSSDRGVQVVSIRGGPSKKLCDDCLVGDWTSDSRRITFDLEPAGKGGGRIALIDTESLETVEVLADAQPLNRPHLTRDDRWLAFRVGPDDRAPDADDGSQIFIAPFRPGSPPARSEWVAVGEREPAIRPCGWSPGGRMLYFVSSRDGFRCLYGQPWDPEAGRLEGPARLVRHFHSFRNLSGPGANVISTGAGTALTKDAFLLDFATTVSNLWTLRLPVDSSGG